ncbi:MAG: CaiB/BaiF CoA-transferase family protein [Gammaproteobacteria bacterium]|nr:CaiB/BaiF CoA-transferase family protein [Gammaproteobacteria bacterium]
MSALTGLKVLELANILAGPMIGQFCAELGADVIKVEQPGSGDPTRGWRLAAESPDNDVSAYFSSANWGKRSIALNMVDDHETVIALIRRADVVIVGYKPGDEVKFGVDYPTVAVINPALIYLQLTAYGTEDPRPGFDAVIQAESGFTFLNGETDGGPVKMPVALVDLLAAHQLKQGLLLALLERERSGKGGYVATSLLAAATASLANQATNFLVAGNVPQRMGSEHPNIVPYGTIFETGDGTSLVVAVGTERQYRTFLRLIEREELADDARFATNQARVVNREALNALLRERLLAMDGAALAESMRREKVPVGFVNDMRSVFEQPESRKQLFDAGNGLRSLSITGTVEGRRDLSPPPHLDQHRAEILRELELEDA